MLHKYAFSNFQSFRDRTEVSWQPDRKVHDEAWTAQPAAGERLSTVMAVIGPNASGKTGLLKAMAFVHWFMTKSFQSDPALRLPYFPHAAARDLASEFEVDFDLDGQLFRYVLHTRMQRVLHEALHVKRQRMGYVFVRDWNEADQKYNVKQQDFGFLPAEAAKVRQNASLISTAAQYGVPLAQRIAETLVWGNINESGRLYTDAKQVQQSAQFFVDHPEHHRRMVHLLSRWDLGLSNVNLRSDKIVLADGSSSTAWSPHGVHQLQDDNSFELSFELESSGTQSAFMLLSRLLPALEAGGLAIIDELENDLHPHMLEPVLDLFASQVSNPRGAQLLFTCHALQVLHSLHKSQVMLVEKNEHNESRAWRLGDMQGVRNDDNLYGKYMAGAYGATPYL